jgi:hypothetical protein
LIVLSVPSNLLLPNSSLAKDPTKNPIKVKKGTLEEEMEHTEELLRTVMILLPLPLELDCTMLGC